MDPNSNPQPPRDELPKPVPYAEASPEHQTMVKEEITKIPNPVYRQQKEEEIKYQPKETMVDPNWSKRETLSASKISAMYDEKFGSPAKFADRYSLAQTPRAPDTAQISLGNLIHNSAEQMARQSIASPFSSKPPKMTTDDVMKTLYGGINVNTSPVLVERAKTHMLNFRNFMNNDIDQILGVEVEGKYPEERLVGRADLFARFKDSHASFPGQVHLIDIKGSQRGIRATPQAEFEETIKKHLPQLTIYSWMAKHGGFPGMPKLDGVGIYYTDRGSYVNVPMDRVEKFLPVMMKRAGDLRSLIRRGDIQSLYQSLGD